MSSCFRQAPTVFNGGTLSPIVEVVVVASHSLKKAGLVDCGGKKNSGRSPKTMQLGHTEKRKASYWQGFLQGLLESFEACVTFCNRPTGPPFVS